MNYFNKLAYHKFKIAGLIVSVLAIILLVTLHILDFQYEEGWNERIFIFNHYIIIMGLFMIMSSREIREDEGVQKVRQTLMKLTFMLLIAATLLYITLTTLDRIAFSVFTLLYLIESALILYNLTFRFCLVKSPGWIFNEKEMKKSRFIALLFIMAALIIWIIFSVIEYRI